MHLAQLVWSQLQTPEQGRHAGQACPGAGMTGDARSPLQQPELGQSSGRLNRIFKGGEEVAGKEVAGAGDQLLVLLAPPGGPAVSGALVGHPEQES